MASLGRGRGYFGSSNMRRPGESLLADGYSDLISEISTLSLEDKKQTDIKLNNLQNLVEDSIKDESSLRSFINKLHERSLEDRQFALKAAAACGAVGLMEVDGVKFRNVLLSLLQKDFAERTQLQTRSSSKFLNAVSLLGEIFFHVRTADGSPISILATPLLHYQDQLLAGEEHDLEVFTTQIAINGKNLKQCSAEKLDDLLVRVRSTIMAKNLSGQCRCWLLLTLDLASNDFKPPSRELRIFYEMHLGTTVFTQMERHSNSNTAMIQIHDSPPPLCTNVTPIVGNSEMPALVTQVEYGKISPKPPTEPLSVEINDGNRERRVFARNKSGENDRNFDGKVGNRARNDFSADNDRNFDGKGGNRARNDFSADNDRTFDGKGGNRARNDFNADNDRNFDRKGGNRARNDFSADNDRTFDGKGGNRARNDFSADDKNFDGKGGSRARNDFPSRRRYETEHDDRFEREDEFYGRQQPRENRNMGRRQGKEQFKSKNRDSESEQWENRNVNKNSNYGQFESKTSPASVPLPPTDEEESWD